MVRMASRADPKRLMLIGHNPGLHDLALALAARHGATTGGGAARALAKGYPTGTLAE